MSGWSGWEADIIVAVGGSNNQVLRDFLAEWQRQEPSSCRDNPMLASRPAPGSTGCKALPSGSHAQAYRSTSQGTNATAAQLKSGNYPHLLEVFKSGSPWTPITGNVGLYNNLIAWGVPHFAAWYAGHFQGGLGSGGAGGGGSSTGPQAYGGWAHLRRAFNRDLPAAVRVIRRNQDAALRELRHGRKVRR